MIDAQFFGKAGGGAGRSGRRTGRSATGCLRWVGLLALLSLALPAQLALGQERTPTPSGKELRETYPLHPSPTPQAGTRPAPSPAVARTEAPRTGSSPDPSGPAVPTAGLIVLALAAGAGALAVARLRRRRAAVAGQSPTEAEPTARPSSADQVDQVAAPTPPDPQRRWSATIQWRHTEAASQFCVVAGPVQGPGTTVLASSEPLEWPPSGPASVQALSTATEQLAASLVSAGWRELPAAGEWYAKRFAWEPGPSAPVEAPVRDEQESGRVPRAGRSDATRELWHCEIERESGSVNAGLRVAVYPPGVGPASAAGSASAPDAPRDSALDPEDPERRAQVQHLAARLEAAGWERVARGPEWFAERFVWRHEGAPPDPVADSVPDVARLGR